MEPRRYSSLDIDLNKLDSTVDPLHPDLEHISFIYILCLCEALCSINLEKGHFHYYFLRLTLELTN